MMPTGEQVFPIKWAGGYVGHIDSNYVTDAGPGLTSGRLEASAESGMVDVQRELYPSLANGSESISFQTGGALAQNEASRGSNFESTTLPSHWRLSAGQSEHSASTHLESSFDFHHHHHQILSSNCHYEMKHNEDLGDLSDGKFSNQFQSNIFAPLTNQMKSLLIVRGGEKSISESKQFDPTIGIDNLTIDSDQYTNEKNNNYQLNKEGKSAAFCSETIESNRTLIIMGETSCREQKDQVVSIDQSNKIILSQQALGGESIEDRVKREQKSNSETGSKNSINDNRLIDGTSNAIRERTVATNKAGFICNACNKPINDRYLMKLFSQQQKKIKTETLHDNPKHKLATTTIQDGLSQSTGIGHSEPSELIEAESENCLWFHEQCLRCSTCNCLLDKNCFVRQEKIFCRRDYIGR